MVSLLVTVSKLVDVFTLYLFIEARDYKIYQFFLKERSST